MTDGLQPLLGEAHDVAAVSSSRIPTIAAQQLLGEVGVLAILHGDDTYQLTRTKQNKLLLTKCQVTRD